MKEVICSSLMRGMAGEYPETPGIWDTDTPQFRGGHSKQGEVSLSAKAGQDCGVLFVRVSIYLQKEKPGLILGFVY